MSSNSATPTALPPLIATSNNNKNKNTNSSKTPPPSNNNNSSTRKQLQSHPRHNQLLMNTTNNNNQNVASAPQIGDPKLVRFYQPFHSYILNPSSTVKEEAKRTHPKGFRYRVMSSPLERNMNSYFRLPTEPPKRAVAEFATVHQYARKAERRRMQQVQSAQPLNGFALLQAADAAEDPASVVEVSICGKNFGSVVMEDLVFFTALRVLDAGDNENLTLAQFSTLPALEELHLHCNMLNSMPVVVMDSASNNNVMLLLHTLNVAFNRLTRKDLVAIGKSCPALQRLDFSHNILGTLDRDEDQLGRNFGHLTQLALENNGLADGAAVFSALSEIPHLRELNCNGNKFETVSLLPPKQQQQQVDASSQSTPGDEQSEQKRVAYVPSVPFPSLNTLGLANNSISSIEAIAALSRFPSLRRVILWGNPLQKQRRFESDLVAVEFESIGVQALMQEPGKMNRAKVGKFYNKNDCPFFAVEATEGSGLPRQRGSRGRNNNNNNKNGNKSNSYQQNASSIVAATGLSNSLLVSPNLQGDDVTAHNNKQEHDNDDLLSNNNNNNNDFDEDNNNNEDDNATGPSFFMTEGDDNARNKSKTRKQQQNNNNNNNNVISSSQSNQQQHMSPANTMTRENPNIRNRVQANAIGSGILPSSYGQPMRSISANEGYRNNNNNNVTLDPIVEGGNGNVGIGNLLSGNSTNKNQDMLYGGGGGSGAGATLRSVVGDLRRALRQPLPPLPL